MTRANKQSGCLLTLAVFWFASFLGSSVQSFGDSLDSQKSCAGLSAPGKYPDFEPLPKYQIERREYAAGQPSALLLRISVPTEALNGTSMARLACDIAARFRTVQRIEALIFDDREAARNLAPGFTDQAHYGKYLWHLKARFESDPRKGVRFIEFLIPQLQDGILAVKKARLSLSD